MNLKRIRNVPFAHIGHCLWMSSVGDVDPIGYHAICIYRFASSCAMICAVMVIFDSIDHPVNRVINLLSDLMS